MRFEKVHTVREYWDGVRSGTADFKGAPHYFVCPVDARVTDGYADYFDLYPLSPEFMERELQYFAIYRAWDIQHKRGLVPEETHPGRGGVDAQYDELSRWLDSQIAALDMTAIKQRATFRAIGGQADLPKGVMRELEVRWSPMSPFRPRGAVPLTTQSSPRP
jgi:hypothetical protein